MVLFIGVSIAWLFFPKTVKILFNQMTLLTLDSSNNREKKIEENFLRHNREPIWVGYYHIMVILLSLFEEVY